MLVINTSIISKKTGAKFSNFYNADSDYAQNVSEKVWKKAWASYSKNPSKWMIVTTLKDLDKKAPAVEQEEDGDMPF